MFRITTFLLLILAAAVPCATEAINPDSVDWALSVQQGDSALSVRARLAYSRGLYHSALDLLEMIESPSQLDLFYMGQCCHVLARPYAARGYFSRVEDSGLKPLAILGLAELYCGDLADPDSCDRYIERVEDMDYLGRFVELTPAGDRKTKTVEENALSNGAWTLQFGAFKMRSLAERMAVKVRGEGIPSRIVPTERGDGTLFFVYGGRYATRGDAVSRADALAKEFACKVVETNAEVNTDQ